MLALRMIAPQRVLSLTIVVRILSGLGMAVSAPSLALVSITPNGKRLIVLAPESMLAQIESLVNSLDAKPDELQRELLLDEAWAKIQTRLLAMQKRPWLIMSPSSLRELHEYTALSIIFSIGAVVGAMITMFAAVSQRTGEIGTLRALGFRRGAVLVAFLG